jgi:hypothetical protein
MWHKTQSMKYENIRKGKKKIQKKKKGMRCHALMTRALSTNATGKAAATPFECPSGCDRIQERQ